MNFFKYISKNAFLLSLPIIAFVCIFIFHVFYYPAYAKYVQINYINLLLLVLFLVLILFLGIILGRSKKVSYEIGNILTEREKEIVLLIIKRKKNIEIANELFVELSTIKSHINNIYKKESVKNRKEIINKYQSLLKSKQ